jgi:hypothetical protein
VYNASSLLVYIGSFHLFVPSRPGSLWQSMSFVRMRRDGHMVSTVQAVQPGSDDRGRNTLIPLHAMPIIAKLLEKKSQ